MADMYVYILEYKNKRSAKGICYNNNVGQKSYLLPNIIVFCAWLHNIVILLQNMIPENKSVHFYNLKQHLLCDFADDRPWIIEKKNVYFYT